MSQACRDAVNTGQLTRGHLISYAGHPLLHFHWPRLATKVEVMFYYNFVYITFTVLKTVLNFCASVIQSIPLKFDLGHQKLSPTGSDGPPTSKTLTSLACVKSFGNSCESANYSRDLEGYNIHMENIVHIVLCDISFGLPIAFFLL